MSCVFVTQQTNPQNIENVVVFNSLHPGRPILFHFFFLWARDFYLGPLIRLTFALGHSTFSQAASIIESTPVNKSVPKE